MKSELKAALIGTGTGDEKLFAELARMTAGKNCHLFTRSARTGVSVQMTIFWNRDGELIPLSHRNINTFSDMVREGIADNVTITAA